VSQLNFLPSLLSFADRLHGVFFIVLVFFLLSSVHTYLSLTCFVLGIHDWTL
jgi:VIT1/CCC1 family predicted Fe2+/Mn2+ transporter